MRSIESTAAGLKSVKAIYVNNPFFNFCGFSISAVGNGTAVLELKINAEKHINHSYNVHGGVIAALIDSSLGVVAAGVGKRVVTSALSISLLKSLPADSIVQVHSKIVSDDGQYMAISSEVFAEKKLVANGTATMVIVGEYKDK